MKRFKDSIFGFLATHQMWLAGAWSPSKLYDGTTKAQNFIVDIEAGQGPQNISLPQAA